MLQRGPLPKAPVLRVPIRLAGHPVVSCALPVRIALLQHRHVFPAYLARTPQLVPQVAQLARWARMPLEAD